LQTVSKITLEKVVDLTELDKTQRTIGLLCAAFKVMSHSFWTFCMPINLPYFPQTYYIMFVKVYYWNYSGDRGP